MHRAKFKTKVKYKVRTTRSGSRLLTTKKRERLLNCILKSSSFDVLTDWNLEVERFLELRAVPGLNLRLVSRLLRRQQQESDLGVMGSSSVLARDVSRLVYRHRHPADGRLVMERDANVSALRDENSGIPVVEVSDVKKMLLTRKSSRNNKPLCSFSSALLVSVSVPKTKTIIKN